MGIKNIMVWLLGCLILGASVLTYKDYSNLSWYLDLLIWMGIHGGAFISYILSGMFGEN